MTRPERRQTFRMLLASTYLTRPSDASATIPADQVAEIAVVGAAELLEDIARLGLHAATRGSGVYPARLRLAAARAFTRAVRADLAAGSFGHIQDIVDRLDPTMKEDSE